MLEQEKKFYSIKEFSQKVGVEEYVLRYWESVFPQFRPYKTEKGHRRYTDEHISIVNYIKELMWVKKYTIEGAKKALKEYFSKNKTSQNYTLNFESIDVKKVLTDIRNVLEDIIKILEE